MISWLLLLAQAAADPHDWPMYNRDARGWRHNDAERRLSPETVPGLEEKWRFPADGSGEIVGAIHATPVVVNGHVYFGTATHTAFYKLRPDGTPAWVYRPGKKEAKDRPPGSPAPNFLSPQEGFLASALVVGNRVYAGDVAGVFTALDRATGKVVWEVDSRAAGFPDAHAANTFMASPIPAGGKIVVGGGGYEHPHPLNPLYACCTGRGFVVAFEPETGAIAWKYDVGPRPEKFDKPIVLEDANGKHVFTCGPATSSVWSTPSYDRETASIYFGTDVQNSPRKPTPDDPRPDTVYSSAVIALDAATGREKWVTQINRGDVFNLKMSSYDPVTKRYKDQSVGDTPKLYDIDLDGSRTRVLGFGCKNGGYYLARADDGRILAQTPVYLGPPDDPLTPPPDPRTLALPSPIGGLQTGCATDGTRVFTNGIDHIQLGVRRGVGGAPTGGRVACLSPSTDRELWRHERPKVGASGDPVGSGIALAGGVAFFTTTVSGRLVALEAATGRVLKEIEIGTVWSGPSVSRGRVYVGTGSVLFYGKQDKGTLRSFGLPGEDEVGRMGRGDE